MPSFCFICRIPVEQYEFKSNWRENVINCPRCGKYTISERLATEYYNHPPINSHIYSGAVRENFEKGNIPWIESWEEILSSVRVPKNPLEKVDRFLFYLVNKENSANTSYIASDTDYSLTYSPSLGEFHYLLNLGVKLKYLEWLSSSKYRIDIDGWKRLGELTQTQQNSSQAFVAMSFDIDLKDIWENGLKPALEKTGYSPTRMDIVEHNGKIDDQIIAEIRKSGLVVADFTGQREGVYFEAGLAMGIGIPVIWTCRESDLKNVHFDTRQYNYIGWTDVEDLKQKLINRIEATLPNRTKGR